MNRFLDVAIIVLACALTYSNTFENGLHMDDLYRVHGNPGVEEFSPPWRHFADPSTSATLPRLRQYRPLLPLSLSINYAIAGPSLVGYHIGNLLLQILASCVLLFLLHELFGHWSKVKLPRHGPLLVTLLFALHPVSGTLVNYICARDLVMMQMFLLGSLLCYCRMRRIGETKGRWAVCLGLLLLSLLSKKNAVVAPALILLFELFPAGGSIRDRAVWRRVKPIAAVVALLLLFARYGIGFSDLSNVVSGEAGPYAAAQIQHHVFHYLRNFVWPFPMRMAAFDALEVWKQILGAAGILGSLAIAWRWRHTRPLLTFGVLGYWTLLAVTSSVVPFHSDIVPYRPYPSSALLFLVVGGAVLTWPRAGSAVLIALAVYFGAASFVMNATWKDNETMYRHSIAYGGTKLAYASLADILPNGPEKERLYLEAIERDPTYVIAIVGLGFTQIAMGKTEEGLRRTREAVLLSPHVAQIRYCAAQSLFLASKVEEAANEAMKASELQPESPEYRCLAGTYAVDAGRFAEALRILKPLLERRPDYAQTRWIAGLALFRLGQVGAAIRQLDPYANANPGDARAWFLLGTARIDVGDPRHAVEALLACLRADPNYHPAHEALAECYTKLGDHAAAKRHQQLFQRGK